MLFGLLPSSRLPGIGTGAERARVKPRAQAINTRARLYIVLMLLALGSTALIVRAIDLQIVRKDFYQEQGDARFLRDMAVPVSRGSILDRNGEPLAVSTPVDSIWADPQKVLEHEDRLDELATALGIDADVLKQRLNQRVDKEFVYLKRHLNPDDAEAITKLGIPGVSSQREFRRYYPSGEVMAHVLGYTNIDDRGQEGLELAFDGLLAGSPGSERVIRDNLGRVVEHVELTRKPEPGVDLTLSIDRRIQYLAYRELKAAIIDRHASSGSMVILDARNGEVLALVNNPSFNPNAKEKTDPHFRRNRALTDVVEPGSTMKAFTIAAALESGKWKPDSKVDTNPGTYQISNLTIHDVHNHGLLTLTGVITKSSNIGAAKVAETLPKDNLYDMYHRFGFGESTGSGFPGESPGFLPIVKAWGPVESDDLVRLRPQRDAAATGARLRHARERWPTARADVRQGCAESRQRSDRSADRPHDRADAAHRGHAGRHRVPAGRRAELLRRRQDRHRAHRARRQLPEPLHLAVRRHRAGNRAAPRRRRRDQRSGRRPGRRILRRHGRRADIQPRHGRRAAPARRAARQRAALVRGRTRHGRAARHTGRERGR